MALNRHQAKRFDWPSFLRQHNIEYVTKGPNTGRDHVSIRCPWCGQNDPSQHMGVSTQGFGYSCWRNSLHRGRAPEKLVQMLLHCDAVRAHEIVYGSAPAVPTQDAMKEQMQRMRGGNLAPVGPLEFLPEFRALNLDSVSAAPYINYMWRRGYTDGEIKWLIETYDLQYATKGRFAHRLVIPIHDRNGDLMTWTARSVRAQDELRYKALSMFKPNGIPPFGRCAPKETLFGLPILYRARQPRVLVLVEGPFDAWRIITIGRGLGVYATCLFGMTVQPGQMDELAALSKRFDRVVLLLDPDAEMHRLRLHQQLAPIRGIVRRLSGGVKDPADLSPEAATGLCVSLLS